MTKTFFHESLGEVVVTKRKGNRHLRLRVSQDGTVRVSMPKWLTYQHAIGFIKEKHDWILTQQSKQNFIVLADGLKIGKAHHIRLSVTSSSRASTRTSGSELKIFIPNHLNEQSPEITKLATRSGTKLLKAQATNLLAQRLAYIASSTGLGYSSLKIGSMKSRWGSCTNKKEITLNCFLLQLPWHLIDYVILHELVHTQIMSHGPRFWNELEKHQENYKELKKELKNHHPSLNFS